MKKSGLKNAAVFAAFMAFVCSSGALALDATSFDPRNVSVEADSISGVPVGTIITWPVATNPEGWDEGKWLECNGQTISQTVYPELFAAIGPKVPDLRGQFLRGIRDGYTLGQKVGNTLGRHNHTQPVHTHSFSGQLASTALSGTAAGQSFNDTKAGISRSPIQDGTHKVVTSADNAYVGYLFADSVRNKAESSSVTGRLDNGRVNGTIASGGGDPTDYTGDDETAPDHLYVRYLIRARQMPLP